MTGGITLIHSVLYLASLDGGVHTSLLLNGKEELPSLIGDADGKVLNVIGTCCGVNHLVEMRLLLKQQLLVASQAFAKLIRRLVGLIKGYYSH